MGSFLDKYFSHLDKFLHTHLKGVVKKYSDLGGSLEGSFAAMFHDIGKMSDGFQQKLFSGYSGSYSKHSLLSVLVFLSFFTANMKKIMKNFSPNLSPEAFIAHVTSLIGCHHRSYITTDICNSQNDKDESRWRQQVAELEKYLMSCDSKGTYVNFIDYIRRTFRKLFHLNEKYTCDINGQMQSEFDIDLLELLSDSIRIKNMSPYERFFDIRYDYACLKLADEADAGSINLDEPILEKVNFQRGVALRFREFMRHQEEEWKKTKGNEKLNTLRTKIRKTTVKNATSLVRNEPSKRLMFIEAATGSGKEITIIETIVGIMKETKTKKWRESTKKKPAEGAIIAVPYLALSRQFYDRARDAFDDRAKWRSGKMNRESCSDVVWRIDSKTNNEDSKDRTTNSGFSDDEILKNEGLDKEQTHLDRVAFAEETFGRPIIITTFVQVLELLFSNKRKDLFKLPQLRNKIIVLDECQSTHLRTFGVISLLLSVLCERLNCWVIFSSATMPNFSIPEKIRKQNIVPSFYQDPICISPPYAVNNPIFDRFDIEFHIERDEKRNEVSWDFDKVKDLILQFCGSAMVILNTIKDARRLREQISEDPRFKDRYDYIFLLHTEKELSSRDWIIEKINQLHREGKSVLLICTQLVRAGVDLDFKNLYMDIAMCFELAQGAGRSGRNGLFRGNVHVFNLGRYSTIYKNNGTDRNRQLVQWIYDKLKEKNKFKFSELELSALQKEFFNHIQQETSFGNVKKINYHEKICNLDLETAGRYEAIEQVEYGESITIYLPPENGEDLFPKLKQASIEIAQNSKEKYNKFKRRVILYNSIIKEMSPNTLNYVVKYNDNDMDWDTFKKIIPSCDNVGNKFFRFDRKKHYDQEYGFSLNINKL